MSSFQSSTEPKLLKAQQAERDIDGYRICWPAVGIPAGLDMAASSILDWFDRPSTRHDLMDDLVDSLGMDRQSAEDVANSLVQTFVSAGQLVVEGAPSPSRELYDYPPAASP